MEVESNATAELNKFRDSILVTKSYMKIEHIVTHQVKAAIGDEVDLNAEIDHQMMQRLSHEIVKAIEVETQRHPLGEKKVLEAIVISKDIFHTMMQAYLNTMPRQMVKELLQGGRDNPNPFKDYTEDKNFWRRLQMFVKAVNTKGCQMSSEEKEMILKQCKSKV